MCLSRVEISGGNELRTTQSGISLAQLRTEKFLPYLSHDLTVCSFRRYLAVECEEQHDNQPRYEQNELAREMYLCVMKRFSNALQKVRLMLSVWLNFCVIDSDLGLVCITVPSNQTNGRIASCRSWSSWSSQFAESSQYYMHIL